MNREGRFFPRFSHIILMWGVFLAGIPLIPSAKILRSEWGRSVPTKSWPPKAAENNHHCPLPRGWGDPTESYWNKELLGRFYWNKGRLPAYFWIWEAESALDDLYVTGRAGSEPSARSVRRAAGYVPDGSRDSKAGARPHNAERDFGSWLPLPLIPSAGIQISKC